MFFFLSGVACDASTTLLGELEAYLCEGESLLLGDFEFVLSLIGGGD